MTFRKFFHPLISLSLVISLTLPLANAIPAFAQSASYGQASLDTHSSPVIQGSAQVSMTLYQLKTKSDGSQYVVARDGSMVPLPPPGMTASSGQIAIYGDNNGNFWYQSPQGTAVPITDERLKWNEKVSYAKEEKTEKKSKRDERRSNRRALLGSFLGAATGAALGTAVTNYAYGAYNGVPYGYPMYGVPGNMYYMGPNGTPVYVNVNGEQLNNLYSQWAVQQQMVQQNRLQYQQQAQQNLLNTQNQAYQNHLNYQQQRYSAQQANQQARLDGQSQAIDNRQQVQSANMENRQQVQSNHIDNRQQVQSANMENRQQVQSNHIDNRQQVQSANMDNRQQIQAASMDGREQGQNAKARSEGGRFGNKSRSEGGRFGNKARSEGGRFGNKSRSEGGRFGNKARSEGGRFASNSSAGGRFNKAGAASRLNASGTKFKGGRFGR